MSHFIESKLYINKERILRDLDLLFIMKKHMIDIENFDPIFRALMSKITNLTVDIDESIPPDIINKLYQFQQYHNDLLDKWNTMQYSFTDIIDSLEYTPSWIHNIVLEVFHNTFFIQ